MLHNSIPVIMHHHVAPTDRDINIHPEMFESQLSSFYHKGWKTISGEEFLFFLHNKREKPRKCLLLTFDDGFADNFVYAYPLLKKFKMKAMLFVATNFIEDIEIRRDTFVPRTHSEAWKLAFTERRAEVMCTWKELERDLSEARIILEKRLSKKILHFAWPRGSYDKEGIRIAEKSGYIALYTTERGANTVQNLSTLKRLPAKSKNGSWLAGKLPIYSSVLLSRLYLNLRAGT